MAIDRHLHMAMSLIAQTWFPEIFRVPKANCLALKRRSALKTLITSKKNKMFAFTYGLIWS